jgi:prepilin-type N-terminal cleavage/methylation domain-containing protein
MTRLGYSKKRHPRPRTGVSLTELLCVMGILCVLSVFYLGAILRAYQKIMAFIKTLE